MKSLRRNVIGLAGIGSLAYGLWLAWPPLAFVGVGASVVVVVVLIQYLEQKSKTR